MKAHRRLPPLVLGIALLVDARPRPAASVVVTLEEGHVVVARNVAVAVTCVKEGSDAPIVIAKRWDTWPRGSSGSCEHGMTMAEVACPIVKEVQIGLAFPVQW